ncbi:MAG: hypothetical protein FWC15_01715 [Fibromonadales bacterium]|nr:hypothetical protein [Fibromonadales bacterium]
MVDILKEFYSIHYNFGIIAGLMLLLAAWLGSRKNIKAVLILLGICLVYNMVLSNKAKRDSHNKTVNGKHWCWVEEWQKKADDYDPVKELWKEKPADDDVNKRK